MIIKIITGEEYRKNQVFFFECEEFFKRESSLL